MKNGRRGKEGGKRRGEYTVALQRRVGQTAHTSGESQVPRVGLKRWAPVFLFYFSFSPMVPFPCPNSRGEAFSLYMTDYRGTPLTLYWLCSAVAGSIPS